MKLKIKYFLICSLLSFAFLTQSYASEIQWQPYEKGLALAKEKNKKLYIYFFSDNCPWCVKMEKDTFSVKKVSDYLNKNFINIRIDVNKDTPTALHYGVNRFPANIFLESNTTTGIYNRPGYVPETIFMNILEAINLEKYK